MKELIIWKPVKGVAHLKISNAGYVFSIKSNRLLKGHLVGPKGGQYLAIGIQVDGVIKNLKIHRLVAKCFLKVPKVKYDVNHINGNKLDNRATNLECISHAENMAHAGKTGLMSNGESHFRSKLSDVDVLRIKIQGAAGYNQRQIAENFKVNQSVISKITNNKTRKLCY